MFILVAYPLVALVHIGTHANRIELLVPSFLVLANLKVRQKPALVGEFAWRASISVPLFHWRMKTIIIRRSERVSPTIEAHANDELVFGAAQRVPELTSVVLKKEDYAIVMRLKCNFCDQYEGYIHKPNWLQCYCFNVIVKLEPSSYHIELLVGPFIEFWSPVEGSMNIGKLDIRVCMCISELLSWVGL